MRVSLWNPAAQGTVRHSVPIIPSGRSAAGSRNTPYRPGPAARAADDKKALDTIVIDVGDVLAVTDHFVITNGTNPRQVRAVVEGIERDLKEAGGPSPLRIKGAESRQWVLLDYGSFVVHVFDSEMREFYSLERLWADRPRVDWQVALRR